MLELATCKADTPPHPASTSIFGTTAAAANDDGGVDDNDNGNAPNEEEGEKSNDKDDQIDIETGDSDSVGCDGAAAATAADREQQQEQHEQPVFINYKDDKQKTNHEVCYSIVIDHRLQRIIVVFRGSVTREDWTANLTVRQIIVDNPLYEKVEKQRRYLRLHHGFYNYIFEPINKKVDEEQEEGSGDDDNIEAAAAADNRIEEKKTTLFDVIIQDIRTQLRIYPTYEIYTTGVSLGGALTIVFAFFASACEDLMPGTTITCYSFASPKVGNIAFRKACQYYESIGRLRLLRVANDGDPGTQIIRDSMLPQVL